MQTSTGRGRDTISLCPRSGSLWPGARVHLGVLFLGLSFKCGHIHTPHHDHYALLPSLVSLDPGPVGCPGTACLPALGLGLPKGHCSLFCRNELGFGIYLNPCFYPEPPCFEPPSLALGTRSGLSQSLDSSLCRFPMRWVLCLAEDSAEEEVGTPPRLASAGFLDHP